METVSEKASSEGGVEAQEDSEIALSVLINIC
jgi:hypothetical protein